MGDDKNLDLKIDTQSPYFLHPSDAPGAIIIAIRFDSKNYELWELMAYHINLIGFSSLQSCDKRRRYLKASHAYPRGIPECP